MKFPASELQINTLKEGLKITVYVEKEARRQVLEQVHNFIDRPLEVGININASGRIKELGQISGEQRKKIYALFRDIDEYSGQGVESIKGEMKKIFVSKTGSEMFSLSDCDRELAGDFIEFLVGYCFENGISLSEHPAESMDDLERYMKVCVDKKICAVCGDSAELHHFDAIGMGRNRKKVDDSENKVIALCHTHHSEAHSMGRDSFGEKYHIKPVRRN